MNNILPVNLNLKRSFELKDNKNLNLEKANNFKEKINKYSTKDKYKKKDNDEKEVNTKDTKKYIVKEKNIKTKDPNKTESNDIKDQDNNKIEDSKQDSKEHSKNETINGESISKNTDTDKYGKESDIESYGDMKQDVENVIAFLQNFSLQNPSDNSNIDELKNSLEKINQSISNNNLNLKDVENLLKALEETNLPEGFKGEILDKFKSFIQEKINSSTQIDDKLGLDKENVNPEFADVLNRTDNTKKTDKKIQDNINNEDIVLKDVDKNSISIKGSSESSQMNLLNHKDEELEKFEKEFLGISDKEDSANANVNIDNLNIGKISQKLKGITSTQRQNSNINPKDIIDQIVSKGKLTMDKDKSIMEIKLEPESLGKLTLKIAVERGIVTAKFTAENDKVKDIIENNMEDLKNNLIAQGLNVESLSVSVDSQGDLDRHKNILEAMAYNKKMSKNMDMGTEIEDTKENPYLTIDDSFNQLA